MQSCRFGIMRFSIGNDEKYVLVWRLAEDDLGITQAFAEGRSSKHKGSQLPHKRFSFSAGIGPRPFDEVRCH
jgi:hypothetical protein